ncbi:uncharacterized protein MICPUCDRAFT_58057 [Micromonas pusilla CCMP1545]|uniref:ER membrane protein complex subunit 3 n=1 Tax=Micromonas pusilla (strain CCMP1545) TaxID=564608 RepID=C1MTG1_MICPC|nr:uncharacterized protein MICPUCDRAFT_58057 [Micromonas pusilla CCMP1545]EEH57311.1 predicted protein [Micromonas pusilla CCMP1545]|eukprot:XP_003058856.1 predicted protein [Micromonas pusilla CCMP1545]
MADLRLDGDIRNWVLIPITIAMFLVGVVRHNFGKLLKSDAKVDLKALREAQAVIRAERVRNNAGYIQSHGFRQRRHFFCHETTGVFSKKSEKLNPQQQMMSDPSMMTDMLKKNLNMIVPQMLTAGWVNFFFTGFVVGKVPFPLTQRFRGMLQRGIELNSLDVSYISSLSWYFLNFFGLRGVFSLCLGENTLDDAQAMQQQMAMGMDTNKAFGAVKESLDMLQHEFLLHVAEGRAERLLRTLERGSAAADAEALARRD